MKKVIFVSGAYRSETEWGVEENIRKAEEAALRLWKLGWIVICPHKNSSHKRYFTDSKIRDADLRARTFQGVADAMATQWGSIANER